VLTARLREQDGVYGARLTGAGFGGACVALCEKGKARAAAQAALAGYAAQHRKGQVLIPEPSKETGTPE
jgi:galactokinase